MLELYKQTGRIDYFGELYGRYTPLVYGLCLKYLGNIEDAEDAVMQIFEDLTVKVHRSEIREFRTWLYSVTRNHCLQILRRTKREIPADPSERFMETAAVTHLLVVRDNEGELSALEECMKKLPEPQRVSISLFFLEEKSYADVAYLTGYSLKSVKSYIQNGKRNLKICMEKLGVKE